MKKRVSVLVSGLCILTSLSSIGGTLYYSKTHVGTSQQTAQQAPPSLPNQSSGNQSQGQSNDSSSNSQGQSNNNSSNTEQSNNSSSNSQGQTSDQSSNTDQSNNSSSNSQSQSNNSQSQAPSQPNNSQGQAPNQSQNNQSQPSIGMPSTPSSQASLSTIQIVIISVSSLVFMLSLTYLIMSKFGALTLIQTFSGAKPTAIYSIVTAAGTVILAIAITLSSNALLFTNTNSTPSSTQATSSGVITTTTSKSLSYKTVSSTTSDESAILVNNGSELKVFGLTIKKSGDTSNTENSEFYGINSGILVEKNSSALIKNSLIKTTANGANAIFSTGEKSEITVKNTKISTTGDSSRGLDATYGGTINAEKSHN